MACNRLISRAWLVLTVLLASGAGSVTTRDGKRHDGDVRIAGSEIVVHSAGSGERRFRLNDLALVQMRLVPEHRALLAAQNGLLPAGWKSQDIGTVRKAGSSTCETWGLFTINASGWGAWGPEDSLHFAYRSWKGDGQFIARIARVDHSHGAMAGGIMIRESLAPDAPMAAACLHPNGQTRLNRRPTGDAPEFHDVNDDSRMWVRLTRNGELFSAYRSGDGIFWQLVDSHKVPMENEVLVGLAAWATGNAWAGRVQIDSVRLIPGIPAASFFGHDDPLREGVMLRDGTILAGTIQSADEVNGAKLLRGTDQIVVPWPRVARLIFNPMPKDLSRFELKRGVLQTSGDFIEGQVANVSEHPVQWPRPPQMRIGIKSVLFGVRYLETRRDVIAAFIADPMPDEASWTVRTADGSLLRPAGIKIIDGVIVADGARIDDVIAVVRP